MTEARKTIFAVIVDVVCVGVIFLPVIILDAIGDPYSRGFFCNDDTIRHPYKNSTISTAVLISVSILVPVIIFLTVEFSVVRTSGAKSLAEPHFLSLCNPNLTLDEATCGTPLEPKYITDFACSGSDLFPSEPEYLDRVRDSRLSFLSGHASLSAYSMLFAIIYIQRRLTNRNYRLVKPLIQVGCSLFAIYTSLSRISDYKHHPEDVIGGAVLGSVVAVLAHFISTNSVKQGGEAVEQATSTTTLLNLPVRSYSRELEDEESRDTP